MVSEHLPAIPHTDQDDRDRFWAATRSKFVLRTDDKETKFDEPNIRRNRGAFTRRLPPLESKVPVKASPDSGLSDPSHCDGSFSKPNLPGSLEDHTASPAKDVPLAELKTTQNPTVNTSPAKDVLLDQIKTTHSPTVNASPAKDVPSDQLKTTQNPAVNTSPAKDVLSDQIKTTHSPTVNTSPAKDVLSDQIKTTQNPTVNASPAKDVPSAQLKTTQNPAVNTSPAKDVPSDQIKRRQSSFDIEFDKPSTPQRTYQLHGQSKALQEEVNLHIGIHTIAHMRPQSPNQMTTKVETEIEDSNKKAANDSHAHTVKENATERVETPKLKNTDRPKEVLYMHNPSAEKEPLRPRPQFEKAPVKSEPQVQKVQNESDSHTPKMPFKSEPPAQKARIKNKPQSQGAPFESELQAHRAPIKSEHQTQRAPIKSEHQTQKVPIKSESQTPKAPIDSKRQSVKSTNKNLSTDKLVTIFPLRSRPTQSRPKSALKKAPTKVMLPAVKVPSSRNVQAAEKSSLRGPNGLKRPVSSSKRNKEKKLPLRGKKAPIKQMPVRKKPEAKVDDGMKRAATTRKPPLRQNRRNTSNTRNRFNAANRNRKERMVFDSKGNLVLRKDRPPPPPPPSNRPRRPPRPEDLRRRYLGYEAAPRRVRPAAPLSGPKPQLSRREAGQWRRVHRKFGTEPTARRRVTRHDRYLQRVERVQLEAAMQHNAALAEMARRRESSKWRQAAQLWKVRDRFREEQQERWRRQWVTPKTTRHEVADRHLYGLPENELAPVMEAPERPRRAPIERFDYAERRRVNLRRYAAHLGLDRQPCERGDARMPRVRPPAESTEIHREIESMRKGHKVNSKTQDESLEISGTRHDGDRHKKTNDRHNSETTRNRRIYQAHPQSQRPQNFNEKRLTIPITTRTGFATRLTARTGPKQRDHQANETKRRKNTNDHEQQPQQLTKREKAVGSVASLRTVDFLDDDPELDDFDAFDKARIKYKIEIDNLSEDDES